MDLRKKLGLSNPSLRVFLFSFTAVAMTGIVFHPDAAQAKWTRTHASHCMNLGGGSAYDASSAIWNNSTTSALELLCAVSDTDYLAKGSLTELNIHGKDGHPSQSVDAMACRATWWVTGGACSAIVSSPTGTPDYTLSPNRSVWSGGAVVGDFGYVWVRLPVKSGSSRSSLRGFYTTN